MNTFNKITEQVLKDNEKYSRKVNVNLYIDDDWIGIEDVKAIVSFDINQEVRSWGIENINVDIHSISNINTIIVNDLTGITERKDLQIIIDARRLKTKTTKGGAVSVGDLYIYCDEDGNVNYDLSEIVIYTF